MSTVGVIVNPLAGKDLRRLVSAASHTSDSAKIGIVRRVIAAAAESGAERILIADDPHRLAARAADSLGAPIEFLSHELTGTRADTTTAARSMRERGTQVIVALGGDGTCRDIAKGWADAPLIAISTGTNNVYPAPIDGTSAGAAAALVAAGVVDLADVARPSKRVVVRGTDASTGTTFEDLALVEVALIAGDFVGARAVSDPASIRAVVAAIATPASTGLSSIAGRVHPVGRLDSGGVHLALDPSATGARPVRVPLAPGTFTTLGITEVSDLPEGSTVTLCGPGILAFDGERDRRIGTSTSVVATVDRGGPLLIDVESTLMRAARVGAFDARSLTEVHHG